LKICALASAYDLIVIPHGHSSNAGAHLTAAQPATLVPLQEYLIKWNVIHQWFLHHPVTPVGGVITLDDRPGLGMELDEKKIEEMRPLSWTETRWS
jgi:L-rhamnonate dehydratase